MGSIDIAYLGSSSYATRTSWSTSLAVPAGKSPAAILVIAHANYADIDPSSATLDGVSMTSVGVYAASYCRVKIFEKNYVSEGSHSVSVTGITNLHESGLWAIGVYNTLGRVSIVPAYPTTSPFTATPTLVSGQLWFEIARHISTMPNATSGQTTLTTMANCKLAYKKDNGVGTKSFSWTIASGTNNLYVGMEFMPLGSLFHIPPMPIG